MGQIEALAQALQAQVPATQVIHATDVLRTYAVDGVVPHLLVTPTTVTEAAQVIGLAAQHHVTLLPRGRGSHMNLGDLPQQVDVLMFTNQLTHLLEHEGPDLTCHVEAGCTLAHLQTQLARKGQRLALDPADAEQATLGGILACNASGPRRLRYGTARDLVIGLRVIQANGEIARSGGRVVKNVAGYDLNKLYIGSLGTLGVIVEANFKLHPLPVTERTLLLTYTCADEAMLTTLALLSSPLTPSALELVDAATANTMTRFSALNLPAHSYMLAINFEGSATTIQRQIDETHLLARRHNALIDDDLEGQEQDLFWRTIRERTRGTLTCKVALLPAQIAPYLQQVAQISAHYDLAASIVAHAGNGILYIELQPIDAELRLISAITELRRHAQEAHGSLVIERCPQELKPRVSIWGEPGQDFPMMQRLKQQFDPKDTFVRGRFLGGL